MVIENGKKTLYGQLLKAVYGMLQAALLWYMKFKSDLEGQGFRFNPYDPCVANRLRKGKQHTVRFHVDDLMSSHVHSTVKDDFYEWRNAKYGEFGEVTVKRENKHKYLRKMFLFEKKKLKIDIHQVRKYS